MKEIVFSYLDTLRNWGCGISLANHILSGIQEEFLLSRADAKQIVLEYITIRKAQGGAR